MTDRGVVLQLSSMVPPARFGGAERVVASFGEDLDRAGFRVENWGLKPRNAHGQSGLPIRNTYWPFDGQRRGAAQRLLWHAVDSNTLASRRSVERLVDEVRPDVMITHNLRGWGLAPWVVAGERQIPLLHVIHDYGLLCNSSTLWGAGNICGRPCLPCRPRAKAAQRRWPGGLLVGVSNAVVAEHYRRGFTGSGRAAVVHPVQAAQDPECHRSVREDGIPHTVGYLGRFSADKGISLLLDAIVRTDKRLVAAGEGERSEVERLKMRAWGQVQWRGWTDPGPFLDEIDVLVVPSVWLEPFGLVVVEAARAGVPVLLADQPGLIEAARASGARHLTFEANSVEALSEALGRPLSDYRTEMASLPDENIVDLVGRLVPQRRG